MIGWNGGSGADALTRLVTAHLLALVLRGHLENLLEEPCDFNEQFFSWLPPLTGIGYAGMSRQELRIDLEQYDFVAPTGVPLAPFLDFLMKETWNPKTPRAPAKTSKP